MDVKEDVSRLLLLERYPVRVAFIPTEPKWNRVRFFGPYQSLIVRSHPHPNRAGGNAAPLTSVLMISKQDRKKSHLPDTRRLLEKIFCGLKREKWKSLDGVYPVTSGIKWTAVWGSGVALLIQKPGYLVIIKETKNSFYQKILKQIVRPYVYHWQLKIWLQKQNEGSDFSLSANITWKTQ